MAAGSSALCLLLAGCQAGGSARAGNAGAPSLEEGANPNAPFMVMPHRAQLVKRPQILDAGAAAPCNASQLSLDETGAEVQGERRAVRLSLSNHGAEACSMRGYPAVTLLHADGSLLGDVRLQRSTATTLTAVLAAPSATQPVAEQVGTNEDATLSPHVLLPAGGEASFVIGWTGGPQCEQVGQIEIAAPGTTHSFAVNHPLSICDGHIFVTAVAEPQ